MCSYSVLVLAYISLMPNGTINFPENFWTTLAIISFAHLVKFFPHVLQFNLFTLINFEISFMFYNASSLCSMPLQIYSLSLWLKFLKKYFSDVKYWWRPSLPILYFMVHTFLCYMWGIAFLTSLFFLLIMLFFFSRSMDQLFNFIHIVYL